MVRISNVILPVAIAVALAASPLDGAKPPADIPLLVSFSNSALDAVTGDGFTAPGYEAQYANGVENILALIQPSGNFRFGTQADAHRSPLRSVCIDFGTQFSDQGRAVPFSDANPRQCVNVLQPMHAYATGDVSIASLRYGQSVLKLTRVAWDDGGYRYRVGYGTDMNADDALDSPAVRVTCIAPSDAGTPCTTWVLAPSTDGTAALFRFPLTNKRGNVQEGAPEFMGMFVMPFAQTLQRK